MHRALLSRRLRGMLNRVQRVPQRTEPSRVSGAVRYRPGSYCNRGDGGCHGCDLSGVIFISIDVCHTTHRSHHPPRPRRGAATAPPPRPAHAPYSPRLHAAVRPGVVMPSARRFSTARCSIRCSGRPQVTRPAAPPRDRAPGRARARPPSPGPDAAPGGTWRRHGQAAHLVCVTLPGVQASHGQPQSSEEVEPCRD